MLMTGIGLILLALQACSRASAKAVPAIPAPEIPMRFPAQVQRNVFILNFFQLFHLYPNGHLIPPFTYPFLQGLCGSTHTI